MTSAFFALARMAFSRGAYAGPGLDHALGSHGICAHGNEIHIGQFFLLDFFNEGFPQTAPLSVDDQNLIYLH